MAIKDQTTTTLVNVSGNRYRVQRAEVNKDDLVSAFNQVKSDTDLLQQIVDNGQGSLSITPAVVFRILVYLLAVGRLVVALAIKVHKLENSR